MPTRSQGWALVSVGPAFGKNKDALLTGAEIIDMHAAGTLPYDSVGRSGGLAGPSFRDDVSTSAWRTRSYEVRHGEPKRYRPESQSI